MNEIQLIRSKDFFKIVGVDAELKPNTVRVYLNKMEFEPNRRIEKKGMLHAFYTESQIQEAVELLQSRPQEQRGRKPKYN